MQFKIIKVTGQLDIDRRGSIFLPFGIAKKYKKAIHDGQWKLNASAQEGYIYLEKEDRKIQIYPTYTKRVDNGKKKKDWTFTIVNTEIDKRACLKLILDEHYLSPPSRGVFFAIKEQSKVIACCVLDDLKFGNPKGRYHIDRTLAKSMGLNLTTWGKGFTDPDLKERQKRYIESLGIVWISRIARDRKYYGKGLGRIVVEETMAAIPAVFPDSYKYIEVIRTLPSNPAKNDFLEDMGFNKIVLNKNKLLRNSKAGDQIFVERERCDRVYFWSKLSTKIEEQTDRLFVPLASQPFEWFSSREKTWELRTLGRQYSTDHIFQGRQVELRRGYNSQDRLMGYISSVAIADTMEELFAEVEKIEPDKKFHSVIPHASDLKNAIAISMSILKPKKNSKFIAFKVCKIVDMRAVNE